MAHFFDQIFNEKNGFPVVDRFKVLPHGFSTNCDPFQSNLGFFQCQRISFDSV